jgi:hypothetical protein
MYKTVNSLPTVVSDYLKLYFPMVPIFLFQSAIKIDITTIEQQM